MGVANKKPPSFASILSTNKKLEKLENENLNFEIYIYI